MCVFCFQNSKKKMHLALCQIWPNAEEKLCVSSGSWSQALLTISGKLSKPNPANMSRWPSQYPPQCMGHGSNLPTCHLPPPQIKTCSWSSCQGFFCHCCLKLLPCALPPVSKVCRDNLVTDAIKIKVKSTSPSIKKGWVLLWVVYLR